MNKDIIYLDENENKASPKSATKIIVNEYDNKGNLIRERWYYTKFQGLRRKRS